MDVSIKATCNVTDQVPRHLRVVHRLDTSRPVVSILHRPQADGPLGFPAATHLRQVPGHVPVAGAIDVLRPVLKWKKESDSVISGKAAEVG